MDLAGLKIAITGAFTTMTRKQAQAQLEALGAHVTGGVSSKTQLLVVGERAGSKLAKAKSLGIPIWDEQRLIAELSGEAEAPSSPPLTTLAEIDTLTLAQRIEVRELSDFPPELVPHFVTLARARFERAPRFITDVLEHWRDEPPFTTAQGVSAENLCHAFTTEALGSCESVGSYEVCVFSSQGTPIRTMISTNASNNVSFVLDQRGVLRFEFSDLDNHGCLESIAITALALVAREGDSIGELKASGVIGRVHRYTGGSVSGGYFERRLYGDTYSGGMFNGLMHGKGTWRSASGEIYKGAFKKDLRHGKGKYTAADGSVSEGQWHEGRLLDPGEQPPAPPPPSGAQLARQREAEELRLREERRAARKKKKKRKKKR